MAEEQVQKNSGEGNEDRKWEIREKHGNKWGTVRIEGLYDHFTLCMGPMEYLIDKLSEHDDQMPEATLMYASFRHAFDPIQEMIHALENKFGTLELVLRPNSLYYHGFDRGDILGVEIQQPKTEQTEQGVDHE